jgi:hypothetical protein
VIDNRLQRMKALVLFALVSAVLVGCGDDDCCTQAPHDAAVDGTLPDAGTSLTEVALIPAQVNRDLDLLFVIDDSSGVNDKRARLIASLPTLTATLAGAPGGTPNLHVGVVSTDLGTKGSEDTSPGPDIPSGSCAGIGKDGVLQTNGAPVNDLFIADLEDANGSRVRNYTGVLADVLTQMVDSADTGCSFEQPLEAIRRALTHPTNAGFVRPSARLAIVVLSDEDDCSFPHSSLLDADTTTLGPLSSFRCTRFGVECDVGGATSDEMNVPGTKHACHPAAGSAYVADLAPYVSFLSELKEDPRDVQFTAIVAPTEPFNVIEYMFQGVPYEGLDASCTYAGPGYSESGVPAVRTTALANALPQGHTINICDADFPMQMVALGQRLKGLVGVGCIQQPIEQPSNCEAFDVDTQGNETPLPPCDDSNLRPCFQIVTDIDRCRAWQKLRVEVLRNGTGPIGTWTSVRCAI